jgi:hypothetical protein
VAGYVGCDGVCDYRAGLIPQTFAGLEAHRIAFLHVDLDIYRAILDTLKFAWPRMSLGAMIVFDDYGSLSRVRERAGVRVCGLRGATTRPAWARRPLTTTLSPKGRVE